MTGKGFAVLAIGALATPILAHILLSHFPNRDDAAVDAIRGAGGVARRTPRLLWLSVITDAPDAFYARGDVWDVELHDSEIGTDVARRLATLRSLQGLGMCRCRVPPGMTTNLVPPSESLRGVSAFDTNLGDHNISGLVDCPNLGHLLLDGTEVTDNAVPTITRCRNLGYIVLRRNKITAAGVAAIREAFPRANVVTGVVEVDRRPDGGPR